MRDTPPQPWAHPHAYLMISERQNDVIERSREKWLRRAMPANPEPGGALKSRDPASARVSRPDAQRWAQLTSAMLEKHGRAERVDYLSCMVDHGQNYRLDRALPQSTTRTSYEA